MLLVCKQLFDLWNSRGVRYCHWKSNEHLEEGLEGKTDLDLYTDPNDKEICEQALRECRFLLLSPQESSKYPLVDEWIGLDSETGNMVHVHLHYRLITGKKFCKEYAFPIGDHMLSTRVFNTDFNVYVASPEVEIIVLFSRIVLKANSLKNLSAYKYEAEFNYLKKVSDNDVIKDQCISILGRKDGYLLYTNIAKESIADVNWKEVFHVVTRWLDCYRTRSRFYCWFRSKYYWFRLYFDILINKLGGHIHNKKVFPTTAVSIAFIGQDGSGKSTITKDVFKWLDWKVSSHIFYLGTGDGYHSPLKLLLKSANAVQTKERDQSNNQTAIDSQTKHSFRKFVGAVLTCLHLVGASISALKKARQAKQYVSTGGVALFDRFPQNQYPGIFDGPKIRHLYSDFSGIMRMFVSCCACIEERNIKKTCQLCPDIVFKLVLSPEESLRRKPFENYELVKKKSEITSSLVFPSSKVIVVDAAQNYASELLLIKNYIWESFLGLQ